MCLVSLLVPVSESASLRTHRFQGSVERAPAHAAAPGHAHPGTRRVPLVGRIDGRASVRGAAPRRRGGQARMRCVRALAQRGRGETAGAGRADAL